MTEFPMRLHPLAPEVKCPTCGAGITFVRVRGHRDLYQCGLCKCQVMHSLNKAGYAPLSKYGVAGVWTACGESPAAKAE